LLPNPDHSWVSRYADERRPSAVGELAVLCRCTVSLTVAIHCIEKNNGRPLPTTGWAMPARGRSRKGENMERQDIDDQLSTTGAQELLASTSAAHIA
jgi:hypothetical protein